MKRRMATALWNQMMGEKFIWFALNSNGYPVQILGNPHPAVDRNSASDRQARLESAAVLREMADALESDGP